MKLPDALQKILENPIIKMVEPKTSRLDKAISCIAIAAFTILSLGLYGIFIYKNLPAIKDKVFSQKIINHNWQDAALLMKDNPRLYFHPSFTALAAENRPPLELDNQHPLFRAIRTAELPVGWQPETPARKQPAAHPPIPVADESIPPVAAGTAFSEIVSSFGRLLSEASANLQDS